MLNTYAYVKMTHQLTPRVRRSFVDIQTTDRQNVDIRIVPRHKNVDISYWPNLIERGLTWHPNLTFLC
jgi:hypothetical protein